MSAGGRQVGLEEPFVASDKRFLLLPILSLYSIAIFNQHGFLGILVVQGRFIS